MRERKIVYTVCYKNDVPTIYNEGTEYEKSCDTFLYCICDTKEGSERIANEMNKTAKDCVYFASMQEDF